MNKQLVISKMKTLYPGKAILCIPEEKPKEIICEIEPTKNHSDYSEAIAVIDQSAKHVHKITTEKYEVIQGTLILTINRNDVTLKQGKIFTVLPNEEHSAKGSSTWVRVTSHPGWTPKDHIVIPSEVEKSNLS